MKKYHGRSVLDVKSIQQGTRKWPKKKLRKPTRYWIRPSRTSSWWDNILCGRALGEEWKEKFRMTRSRFELCCQLGPHIKSQSILMCSPISVECQLAAVL